MLTKILLVGVLVFAVMLAIKDGRPLARLGMTASCSEVQAGRDQESVVQACKRGRLEGYPDLSKDACSSLGIKNRVQYWNCPARVVSSHAPTP